MIRYFDNAATSWPKPPAVLKAMKRYFDSCGGNPGRSGHRRAIEAGRMVLETRECLAGLLNVQDPARITFTKNATEALNMVVQMVPQKGGHVVTTSMEHNSVLRPLMEQKNLGCTVDIVQADTRGSVSPGTIKQRIARNTSLVVCTHASNVTGTIIDIRAVAEVCRTAGVPLLVDAAQTVGVVPIDCESLGIDFLAASGHKGLLGPQGTGFLYVKDSSTLPPLLQGGTGSLSDREFQPDFTPDMYESGTLNTIGIAGLGEGVRYLAKRGVEDIFTHDGELLELFLRILGSNPGIHLYGPCEKGKQTGVLSLNIEGVSCSEAGERLDREFGLLTRIGLHCAPMAHKTVGTFPEGTIRFSWGLFTTKRDILVAAQAVHKLANRGN